MALTAWPTVCEIEFLADLDEIIGITLEVGIFIAAISGKVGAAGPDMIERHDSEILLECRRDEAPHVLIAAETMREEHGAVAAPTHLHIVAL
jgi:hypothetical protein